MCIILLGQPFPNLQTGKIHNYLNFNKLTLADTAEETPPHPHPQFNPECTAHRLR